MCLASTLSHDSFTRSFNFVDNLAKILVIKDELGPAIFEKILLSQTPAKWRMMDWLLHSAPEPDWNAVPLVSRSEKWRREVHGEDSELDMDELYFLRSQKASYERLVRAHQMLWLMNHLPMADFASMRHSTMKHFCTAAQ